MSSLYARCSGNFSLEAWMQTEIAENDVKIVLIESLVKQLQSLLDDDSKWLGLKYLIDKFSGHHRIFSQAMSNESTEIINRTVYELAVYGELIGSDIETSLSENDDIKRVSNQLLNESKSLLKSIPNEVINFDQPPTFLEQEFEYLKLQKIELDVLFKSSKARLEKALSGTRVDLEHLNEKSKTVDADITARLEKIDALYQDTIDESDQQKKKLEGLLSIASNNTLISKFSISADNEKKAANFLRWCSIFFMLLVFGIVAFSFWETMQDDFKVHSSVIRIVLAIMLSVPAAYLARESAKHREQQYNHLQTSLDLAAITPYIASLPEEEQNKIKVDVASRLFAAKDFSRAGADSYPVNVHEVVMELIKKIEPNKS